MSEESQQDRTLRGVLTLIRQDEGTLGAPGTRFRKRLELIKEHVPIWMDFDAKHPIVKSAIHLDAIDFGTLIGRAIVLTAEEGQDFRDPDELWLVASVGLEVDDLRGRTTKLSKADQARLYRSWESGERTQEQLAIDYGVGIATVQRIIRRWKRQ